ncbi:MAG: signal peptidase I [Myxococcota bacterium]
MGQPAEDIESPDPEESAWERFKSNVRMIGGAVLLAIFIRIVLFEAFEIDGPSMEPSLQSGDRVVVAKMLYGLFLPWTDDALLSWGEPQLGDVVIVHSPLDGVDIVKRVVGVAGDTIEVRDRQIIRNGEPLPIEDLGPCDRSEQQDTNDTECRVYEETLGELSYRVSDSGHFRAPTRATTIPEGHVFVRGDHRDRSNDSTNPLIGPVHISRIKGRALAIYLSCEGDGSGGFGVGRFRVECDPRWSRFFMSVR